MARLQRHRAAVAPAQALQEIPHQRGIEGQAGRQLHQQATEFFTQAGGLRQKLVEQPGVTGQALLVCDGPGQLDRKTEIVRDAGRFLAKLAVRAYSTGAGSYCF